MVNAETDFYSSDEDYDLPPERDEADILRAILNNEINPEMPTEDVDNQRGYIFIYYFYNRGSNPNLYFDVPDTWEQWATTFATMTQPLLWETQFVGGLRDRDLVENIVRQRLEQYKSEGIIGEYRMRRNYVRGYE
jgi:hypothetical protein